MSQLHEGLKNKDLKDLVNPKFEIDTFRSKMGNDEDVSVLSFDVTGHQAADDLVNFIEKGYDFVLDADVSSGEVDNNIFKVFVEIERGAKLVRNIEDLIYGLSELCDCSDWKFRYYKDSDSKPLSEISKVVPTNAQAYRLKVDSVFENDMRFFFRRTPLDYVMLEENIFTFKRPFASPIRMNLVNMGTRTEILNDLAGTIRIDEASMSETIWLTKYFGDYNITKYGDHFVFENDNTVLVLQLVK
jgi:hypothetical protein